MTTAVVKPEASSGTLLGLSAGADLTNESLPAGRITAITGDVTTESEYSLLPLDAVFVRSLEDFRSVGSIGGQSFLVTKSGFTLAAELIELGLLGPESPITWSLQAPLKESLAQLGSLGLPDRISVHRIRGTIESVVVSTAGDNAGRLDPESFQAGLAVSADLLGHHSAAQPMDPAGLLQELNVLRRKHLSLLEVLIPVLEDIPGEAEVPADLTEDVRRLESEISQREDELTLLQKQLAQREDQLSQQADELSQLKNELSVEQGNYAALDRKYHALANSRLGKLTLRLWGRKTSKANEMKSKEEA